MTPKKLYMKKKGPAQINNICFIYVGRNYQKIESDFLCKQKSANILCNQFAIAERWNWFLGPLLEEINIVDLSFNPLFKRAYKIKIDWYKNFKTYSVFRLIFNKAKRPCDTAQVNFKSCRLNHRLSQSLGCECNYIQNRFRRQEISKHYKLITSLLFIYS